MQDKISTGGDWTSRLKQRLYQIREEFFNWFQKDESIYFEVVIAIALKNCFNFLKMKSIMAWITETYFIYKWTTDWTRNFFELILYEKKHKLNSEFLEECFFANEAQIGLAGAGHLLTSCLHWIVVWFWFCHFLCIFDRMHFWKKNKFIKRSRNTSK